MRIQHNIPAMNSYRNYNNNIGGLQKNLEKLSSGYKINRAGDDAAGLAISEKMRAQIAGLTQAQNNVKDGVSLVKTAEGALQEVQDMLNRMDTLATQSANGTYDDEVDRANLQKEVDALLDEIDRIADSSNFNGINLLDGTQAAAKTTMGTWGSTKVQASLTTDFGINDRTGSMTMKELMWDRGKITVGNSTFEIKISASQAVTTVGSVTGHIAASTSGTIYVKASTTLSSFVALFNGASLTAGTVGGGTTKLQATVSDLKITWKATACAELAALKLPKFEFNVGLGLQIGDTADSFNKLNVGVMDIHRESLFIKDLNVGDQESASTAINRIKNAINMISSTRGQLGAVQNRLEHTLNNLSVMTENIQDAESTIRDTDIADEMSGYTKNNILLQSAQAMLAQANQMPQGVLQLLQ